MNHLQFNLILFQYQYWRESYEEQQIRPNQVGIKNAKMNQK